MFKFASESSTHGISFIFGENRSKFVRILWIFLLLASFCGFTYYMKLAYTKWSVKPDITVKISEKLSKEFPMPAVTICPMTFSQADQADLKKFANASREKTFINATQAECESLYANLNWCTQATIFQYVYVFCKEYFSNIEELKIVDAVNRSAYKTEDLFNNVNTNMVKRVLTCLGICFSYNMQDQSAIFNKEIHDDFQCYKNQEHPEIEWNVERGYFKENSTYPEKASRKSLDFATMMNPLDAKNPCISKAILLIFHLPNEMPNKFSKNILLGYGSQIQIKITAKSHRTNDNLRSYSPDIRKCYFDGERELEFFKTYSVSHCLAECEAEIMLKACGCVIFWMPRNKTTRVCRLSDIKCFNMREAIMQEEDRLACHCLQPCNDIRYTLLTNEIDVDPSIFNVDRIDSISTMWMTSLSETVEEIENYLAYTLENFISDVGGLLGLFLGCSLLSIVEIFYFLFACLFQFLMKICSKPKVQTITEKSLDHEKIIDILLELRKDVNRLDQGLIENAKKIAVIENSLLKVEEF